MLFYENADDTFFDYLTDNIIPQLIWLTSSCLDLKRQTAKFHKPFIWLYKLRINNKNNLVSFLDSKCRNSAFILSSGPYT